MSDEQTMEEYPQVDPARRKLALAALANTAKRQRAERYWSRVEHAARERWATGQYKSLSQLVTDARELIDEIDAQRAASERYEE